MAIPTRTIRDVVRGTQGALVGGDLSVPVAGVSIDSRTLNVGDVFFAIRGQRFDVDGDELPLVLRQQMWANVPFVDFLSATGNFFSVKPAACGHTPPTARS